MFDYGVEAFVTIEEGQDSIITELCDSIFSDLLSDDKTTEESNKALQEEGSDNKSLEASDSLEDKNTTYIAGKEFLIDFIRKLPKPITIIQEDYHIDRSFRDTYYMYFSNQHFQMRRYSQRLSFFIGKYSREEFFDENTAAYYNFEKTYIGSCVVNPLVVGSIGRTLISPKYALSTEEKPVRVRLSNFKTNIYGRSFSVNAFPYRMQDEETMRCAEVTLLNLLEYYSNSYRDYRVVVPSEIISNEQKHSPERVLPARGITYPVLTKVLSEFGFSPRLYNVGAIDSSKYSSVSKEDELKRCMHYYIESGIPLAINLVPTSIAGTAHSIICIGYGQAKDYLKKKAYKRRWIPWSEREHAHPIINSADFYDDYVVIDDNQPIYHVRNYKNLSQYADMRIENLAVPLYKRMFLDAPNAYTTIMALLHDEKFGINEWVGDFLETGENVIIRVFMASSRSYKNFRMDTTNILDVKMLYTLIPMPRFVWVCELYRVSDYDNSLAFGEVVIDATSTPNRGHRSLILMHYPNVLAYRLPDKTVGFSKMAVIEDDELFPGFKKNLEEI